MRIVNFLNYMLYLINILITYFLIMQNIYEDLQREITRLKTLVNDKKLNNITDNKVRIINQLIENATNNISINDHIGMNRSYEELRVLW